MSYVLPVCLHLRAGRIERGPWHLGGYSKAINVAAVLWVIFLSVILSLADILNTGASILAVTIALALWYGLDRKSTRLNSSHLGISYAVFCLKKKNNNV